jgi:hypothetical protein
MTIYRAHVTWAVLRACTLPCKTQRVQQCLQGRRDCLVQVQAQRYPVPMCASIYVMWQALGLDRTEHSRGGDDRQAYRKPCADACEGLRTTCTMACQSRAASASGQLDEICSYLFWRLRIQAGYTGNQGCLTAQKATGRLTCINTVLQSGFCSHSLTSRLPKGPRIYHRRIFAICSCPAGRDQHRGFLCARTLWNCKPQVTTGNENCPSACSSGPHECLSSGQEHLLRHLSSARSHLVPSACTCWV